MSNERQEPMPEPPAIEIRDPEINVAEIMQRLRARIRERHAATQTPDAEDAAMLETRAPIAPGDYTDADFASDMRLLETRADAILVSLAMRDRHLPIFNSLFYRFEVLLHRLALKYVNQLAGRQVLYNTAAANVIATLAQKLALSEARTKKLEDELRDLRARVTKLARPAAED